MTREFGTPYKRNAVLTQFDRTMQREGKILTTYTGGQEFKAFFRIRNDGENQKETILLYYDVTAPVRPGTLVMYGYDVFLALNRETIENETYYKSAMVKCNGVFNNNDGQGVMNVPFYAENMKSSVSIGNQTISMLSGNIELITEENSLSKEIDINNIFNEFGRTFKITNRYVIDGIVHLVTEVEANRDPVYNYTIEIDGVPDSSVKVGDGIALTATPYINGSITTGATFEWSSSDVDIATVDGTGNVQFIAAGTVSINVTWVEKSITQTTDTIIVSDGSVTPTDNWTITINGRDQLKIGIITIYTFTILLDGIETHLDGIRYEIINQTSDIDFATKSFDSATNKLTLSVEDDSYISEKFMIRAYHTEKGIHASMNVTVKGLF